MKSILVLGAGRSSTSLINYLLRIASARDWQIMVGDVNENLALEKTNGFPNAKAFKFDIHDQAHSLTVIEQADVVISLLPAALHPLVAKACILRRKHFLNASYVSDDMLALDHAARESGLLFLNECGLDPGIDHMTAMQMINQTKAAGGRITSFESFAGGLIAPATDPGNPWRYKFTWNPRNVVMAGQGTARFLMGGQFKYIPYQRLFSTITPVNVLGTEYEGYANRDSLKYLSTYGLDGIETMVRGTLRNAGYCSAWNILVQLGCCDDSYIMEHVEGLTHRDYINAFLNFHPSLSAEEKICIAFNLKPDGPEMVRLNWSGFFTDEKVGLASGTPAQLLEHILNKKWKLALRDRDMIVMWHRLKYQDGDKDRELVASMIVEGDDESETAMSKTVGLPLAIAAKLLLEGCIASRGVVIPNLSEIYVPILRELETLGISISHK
jgi:saccharopine dehydrogenase (NADP+, L-glutamate forming)